MYRDTWTIYGLSSTHGLSSTTPALPFCTFLLSGRALAGALAGALGGSAPHAGAGLGGMMASVPTSLLLMSC